MLKLQLAVLHVGPHFPRLRDQVREVARALEEKRAIPMVAAQMRLIQAVQQDEWWEHVTLPMLEHARKRLRDLVKFIEKSRRVIVVTDLDDQIGRPAEVGIRSLASAIDVVQYKKKVLHFLKAHEQHPAIRKLRQNEPLAAADLRDLERLLYESGELGTRADFERAYDPQPSLGAFVRGLVGLDREAAKRAVGQFLDGSRFSASQIRFVNLLIDHLTKHGAVRPEVLCEAPYTDLDPSGVGGLFDDRHRAQILQILARIDRTATAPDVRV